MSSLQFLFLLITLVLVTPSVALAVDTDGDGVDDLVDADDDNDCIPDLIEGIVDSDSDGVINSLDSDSDNDSVLDLIEGDDANHDSKNDSPIDIVLGQMMLKATDDQNHDGMHDACPGAIQDTDGDGVPDYLDPDDDNDGWGTFFECPNGGSDCSTYDGYFEYLDNGLFRCDAMLAVYGASSSNRYVNEFRINSTPSGVYTVPAVVTALARHPQTGDVWTCDQSYPHTVRRYNPVSGVVTVGDATAFSDDCERLTFSYDGHLYGGPGGADVYEFDVSTGAATLVATVSGLTGTGGDFAQRANGGYRFVTNEGYVYDVDNAFTSANLKGTLSFQATGILYLSSGKMYVSSSTTIYEVNKQALVEKVVATGFNNLGDLSDCTLGISP